MSQEISLNEQIDMSALNAAEQLLIQLDNGMFSPQQAQVVASILLTAFNPIVQSSEFLGYITEISEFAAKLPQPIERKTYVLFRGKDLLTITRTNCKVTMSGVAKNSWDFDTEHEAQNRVTDLIKLTESKGFKLRK